MVGTGRFELPTPRTPSECSTRLSHVPTGKDPRIDAYHLRLHPAEGFLVILHQLAAHKRSPLLRSAASSRFEHASA